ncbi:hypothetical protein ACOMHN_042949 [Nucella lapillus]
MALAETSNHHVIQRRWLWLRQATITSYRGDGSGRDKQPSRHTEEMALAETSSHHVIQRRWLWLRQATITSYRGDGSGSVKRPRPQSTEKSPSAQAKKQCRLLGQGDGDSDVESGETGNTFQCGTLKS